MDHNGYFAVKVGNSGYRTGIGSIFARTLRMDFCALL